MYSFLGRVFCVVEDRSYVPLGPLNKSILSHLPAGRVTIRSLDGSFHRSTHKRTSPTNVSKRPQTTANTLMPMISVA